ncbi:MAG: hypothetical protein ACK4GN_07445 [Runella sp.]
MIKTEQSGKKNTIKVVQKCTLDDTTGKIVTITTIDDNGNISTLTSEDDTSVANITQKGSNNRATIIQTKI